MPLHIEVYHGYTDIDLLSVHINHTHTNAL